MKFIKMISGIYIIKNKITGKVYVGSTVNFEDRWRLHRSRLKLNKHSSPHLQSSWIMYGADAFEFIVHSYVEPDNDLLIKAEQAVIDSYDPINLYNCNLVAGRLPSKKGVAMTESHRGNISKALKGRVMDDEWRAKMSAAKQGKARPKHTPETIQKIRAAALRRKITTPGL